MWVVEIEGTKDIYHGELAEIIACALGRRGVVYKKVKVNWAGPEEERPMARSGGRKKR